ncbi:MAG: glycosyltransferase [Chloroflexota bacterium]
MGDYTRLLAGALAANEDVEVTVLTQRRPSLPSEQPSWGQIVAPVGHWGFGSWRPIVDHLRASQPDILHIQYQTAAYGMHPAINLLPLRLRLSGWRGRVVTTFHDLRPPYFFPKAGAARHLPALWLAWGSDALVLVAGEHWPSVPLVWLRKLRADLGAATHVIPIGSNIPACPSPGYERSAWRRRLGVAPEETLLAFFGFINASKGADDLLRALAELRTAGEAVRLLMVGGSGDSNAQDKRAQGAFEALVLELGLSQLVQATGFATEEEVSAHLMSADLCVLPFVDGATFQRGTLLATLAHGLPTISTAASGADGAEARDAGLWEGPRLVHGDNVWLVPSRQPSAIAAGIRHLASSVELRQRLGDGARRLAADLSWPRIAARHVELYRRLTPNL